MVKRIKKRIPKSEVEPQPSENEQPQELTEQIEELAEDDFTRYTASAFKWVVHHRVAILAVLFGSVVVVAAVTFVLNRQQAGVEQASSAFGEAATAYQKAIEPQPPEDPAAGADEAKKPDAQARQAGLEKARAGFEAVEREHGDRPVASLAALGLAAVEADLGKPGDAVGRYDRVLARPDLEPFARAIVLQARAAALESAGKVDDAVAAWKAVETADKAAFGLASRIAVGRILEGKGDAAGAKAHYEQTKKDFADTLEQPANRQFKADLERRLARLGDDA